MTGGAVPVAPVEMKAVSALPRLDWKSRGGACPVNRLLLGFEKQVDVQKRRERHCSGAVL
jgi:hypothetical protein